MLQMLSFYSWYSTRISVSFLISWRIPFSRFISFVDIVYVQFPQSLGTGGFSLFKPLYFTAIIIIIIIIGGGGGGGGSSSSSCCCCCFVLCVPFLSDLSWFADVIL